MAKVIILAAWVANSYVINGRRRQVSVRTIKREKVKTMLSGGRPGGDCA